MQLAFLNKRKLPETISKVPPEKYFDQMMTLLIFLILIGVLYLFFQISVIESDINTLNKELTNIKGQEIPQQQEQEPRKPEISIEIISPAGGDKLVIGQEYIIKWKAPKVLQNVLIKISQQGFEHYIIGSFPPNFNSQTGGEGIYVWKVGQAYKTVNPTTEQTELVTIPEGFGYEIGISSNYIYEPGHSMILRDVSDGVFSVVKP